MTHPQPILSAGRNCWTQSPVERAGLLIDADNYYRGFYQAARQAQRYLLIAGWRFTTAIRLLRGDDTAAADGPVELRDFLGHCVRNNPQLQVYILAWDYSFNYALEWESEQDKKMEQAGAGRIHFIFDKQHHVGGSHHQKLVIVDGHTAFVGGLDFSAGSWDDRRHLPVNPERHEEGKPHDPYHDVQCLVAGPAVAELTAYFQQRWRRATGAELTLPEVEPRLLPVRLSTQIHAPRVGLSLTEPSINGDEEVKHILQLYRDAIAAAEQLIYIENQYFTAEDVLQALLERMRQPNRPQLDIVMVLPRDHHSWIEAAGIGPPQLRAVDELREAARSTGHRFGVYYTTGNDEQGNEKPVFIHSKVLAVDDQLFTVGSANTSDRSMGLDTELNLTFEAVGPGGPRVARSIRRVRSNLLGEHCGLWQPSQRRALMRTTGLVAFLDDIADSRRHRLRRLTREAMTEQRPWIKGLAAVGFSFDVGY